MHTRCRGRKQQREGEKAASTFERQFCGQVAGKVVHVSGGACTGFAEQCGIRSKIDPALLLSFRQAILSDAAQCSQYCLECITCGRSCRDVSQSCRARDPVLFAQLLSLRCVPYAI